MKLLFYIIIHAYPLPSWEKYKLSVFEFPTGVWIQEVGFVENNLVTLITTQRTTSPTFVE
jgi:hypothetical protein